ncbi:MAG: hypothetical protein ABSD44_06785 [Terracidiphilus sp.]
MRKVALYLLLPLFTMQTAILRAQTAQKPQPKFTLTIFNDSRNGGVGGYPYLGIRIVETNISNEPLQEAGCWEEQGVFTISILYNGVPLKERDEAARKKREADAKLTPCMVPLSAAVIHPGETGTRYMAFGWDYPMSEPGTYEITVSRQTDPDHPDRSVTVKSNTLTVVKSEPGADAPK